MSGHGEPKLNEQEAPLEHSAFCIGSEADVSGSPATDLLDNTPTQETLTVAGYEDGKIILTVSVSDNGGTDITGYEATCTDGTNTYTGTSTSSPTLSLG